MHPKPSPLAIFGIVVLAAFTIFITWRAKRLEKNIENHDQSTALVGKPAPDFDLMSLDGRKITLAEYRGKKKLIVSFWASWCGPCRLELPMLREFYQRHRKPDDNFEILAISIDDNHDDAEEYATKAKLPFPVLLDLDSSVAGSYGVDGIPTMFIVDEKGKVIYGHAGLDETLNITLVHRLGLTPVTPAEGAASDDSSN